MTGLARLRPGRHARTIAGDLALLGRSADDARKRVAKPVGWQLLELWRHALQHGAQIVRLENAQQQMSAADGVTVICQRGVDPRPFDRLVDVL
ncbi:hypothetical protein SDC9_209552 [bioreactor metagenome]|uniref:Uncharacterized protein n=1 Tax=bioreactor metagenome TaxID=1076179 RepID=A0A645JDL2_9ZZZZ